MAGKCQVRRYSQFYEVVWQSGKTACLLSEAISSYLSHINRASLSHSVKQQFSSLHSIVVCLTVQWQLKALSEGPPDVLAKQTCPVHHQKAIWEAGNLQSDYLLHLLKWAGRRGSTGEVSWWYSPWNAKGTEPYYSSKELCWTHPLLGKQWK